MGAYAGIFDGLLEWYHGLLGIEIPERERRPRERLSLRRGPAGKAGRCCASRAISSSAMCGSASACGYTRGVQSVVAVTLPTNTGPDGYGRGVISASLLNTARLPLTPRLVFEGSLSGGYTPVARTARPVGSARCSLPAAPGCVGASGGASRSTAISSSTAPTITTRPCPSLDRRDLSFDFGWVLAGSGVRELRVGMTEDLEPGGPAIDLVLAGRGEL